MNSRWNSLEYKFPADFASCLSTLQWTQSSVGNNLLTYSLQSDSYVYIHYVHMNIRVCLGVCPACVFSWMFDILSIIYKQLQLLLPLCNNTTILMIQCVVLHCPHFAIFTDFVHSCCFQAKFPTKHPQCDPNTSAFKNLIKQSLWCATVAVKIAF